MRTSRRMFFLSVSSSIAGLFGMSGYALGIEPVFRLRVQSYKFTPERWMPGLKLRIAAISDIHASEPYMPAARIRQIVERTNDLKPDLIVLLGDYVVGHTFEFRKVPHHVWAAEFARLSAPLGRYAILGNHDWRELPGSDGFGGDADRVKAAFAAVEIPVLENEALRLTHDGEPFWLLGLGDQLAFKFQNPRRFKGVDDLQGTLAKISDEAPAILLAHEPDIFVKVPDRVSVTLSGHTHGGQVRLFGWSPIVPSRYGNRFSYGHVHEGARHLVVSGGLGVSRIPVRLGMPPEITVIELG